MRGVRLLISLVLACLLQGAQFVRAQDLPDPSPVPDSSPAGSADTDQNGNSSDSGNGATESAKNVTPKKEGAFEFFFKYRPMPKWGKAMDKIKDAATAPVHVVSRSFSSWAPAPTYGYNYSQWTPQYPTYPMSGYPPGPQGFYPPMNNAPAPGPYPPGPQGFYPAMNNAPAASPTAYLPPLQPPLSQPPQSKLPSQLPPSQPPQSQHPSHRFRIQRPASETPQEIQHPPENNPIPAGQTPEAFGQIKPFSNHPAERPVEEATVQKKPLPPGTLDDSVPQPIPMDQNVSRETLNTVAECDLKARDLEKENHIEEAMSQYEKAFTLDPNPASPLIHISAGLLYQKEGKLEEAIAQYKQALAYKPQMPEATLGIASSFQEMGQVSHAILWLQRYLKENPDAKDTKEVQKNLAALKHADSTWEKSNPDGLDYFDTVMSTGDYVWPPYRLPIKVYIQIDTDVPGLRPSLAQMLKDALNEWTAATGYRLCWMPYPSQMGADIVVRWRGNHDGDHLTGGEGGITLCQKMRYSDGRHTIEHATITLWTEDLSGQKLKSDEEMRETTLHEVGHALGLAHSSNNKDVMFFSVSTTQAPDLTSRDKATIARMYMYYPVAMRWR